MTRNRALLLLVGVILVVGVTTLIGLRGGEGAKEVVTSTESKSRAVSILDDVTPTATQAPPDSITAFLEEAWGLSFAGANNSISLFPEDREAMIFIAQPVTYTVAESAELLGSYDEAERMPLVIVTPPGSGEPISTTASAGILTGPTGISKPVYGLVTYTEEPVGLQYGVPTTNVIHVMTIFGMAESINDAQTKMHETLKSEFFSPPPTPTPTALLYNYIKALRPSRVMGACEDCVTERDNRNLIDLDTRRAE